MIYLNFQTKFMLILFYFFNADFKKRVYADKILLFLCFGYVGLLPVL